MPKQKKLKINSKLGHGIRIEKASQYKDSFFQDVYYDASIITKQIIAQNRSYKSEKNYYETERLYNIVTILGERGTGKTSVMKSFIHSLNNVNSEKLDKFINGYGKKQKENITNIKLKEIEFVCLEEIDVSLLRRDRGCF